MIVEPALRYRRVVLKVTGARSHKEIMAFYAGQLNPPGEYWEHAFVNDKGQTLNRHEAAQDAYLSGQIESVPTHGLHSHDIWKEIQCP